MRGAVVCCVIWTPTACGPFMRGKHICQLNNATDKSLASERGFTHLAIEVTSTFYSSL